MQITFDERITDYDISGGSLSFKYGADEGAIAGAVTINDISIGRYVQPEEYDFEIAPSFEDPDRCAVYHYTGDSPEMIVPSYVYYGNQYREVIEIFTSGFESHPIETAILPDTIASLGDRVFTDCQELTSVSFGDDSQFESIPHSAFNSCSQLTSINIPNSVTTIGESAFSTCYSLPSIDIPVNVTLIGPSAFDSCDALETINFAGTMEQFANITKEQGWASGIPAEVVHCTDGD